MIDINNISNNDCRDGYKEVYDMMFNTYKKSHKKDKTDESGSISDRTLVEELDASLSGRKKEKKRNAILFDAQMPDLYSSLNNINNFNSQKKPNLSNNNRNNNNRINSKNNNNNNKKIETELNNKNKIIDFDEISSALDEEINKLSNLLANRKAKEGKVEEDNEDCNDNGIMYIPKRVKSGLCLSPLNTKIKVNVEPTFKKTRSEGLNIDQKLRKQRMHELLKERPKKTKDEIKKPIPKVENDDALSQITDDDSTLPRSQRHKRTRSSKSDKSFVPQVPPRGISKFHLVNKVKRSNKIEDNLAKKNISKPKKTSEKKYNCFSTLLSTNENIKSLSLPKSVKSEEDLNTYMKRKYRESKIKILYRNDYYMQELDDKDYEEYDKALFDEQLFINVGNNETDCSDTLVNESSSPSLSGIFDLTSSFPKDDATVSLIAQGYQQILEKNERNLKEASVIGEQKKKYHHYAAVNDINDSDELAPARSVSYSSIQSIAKSKLNLYPRNRSLSTSNLKSSSNSNNTNASDSGSLKTRSKKKKNHQSTISTKSSPTSTPESACAKLSDYYKEYNSNDKWTYRNRNYSYQNPSHSDYQKPAFLIEEMNNSEISSITSSCYLSSLSSNSSLITRIPSDKKPYNYNYNTAVSYNYPYSNGADALAYY